MSVSSSGVEFGVGVLVTVAVVPGTVRVSSVVRVAWMVTVSSSGVGVRVTVTVVPGTVIVSSVVRVA